MTIEQQANEIVEKYAPYTGNDNWHDKAILCAITEVQAIINSNPHSNPLNTSTVYSTMKKWMDILEHLKRM